MPDSEKSATRAGLISLIVWGVVGLLGTVVGAAIVGLAAAEDEDAGVAATCIVALPIGFLWSGFWGALILLFAARGKKGLQIGGSIGCGVLGGIALLAAAIFFFAVIFPEL